MRDPAVRHNRLNICEVKIDEGRLIDQVRNALHRLLKNFICFLQCFRHRRSSIDNVKKPVIRDHDQRIHALLQLLDASHRVLHPLVRLKPERLCDNADSQAPELLRDARHNRRAACPGTAAHTAGHKNHIRACQSLLDLFRTLGRSLFSDFRLRAGAETLRHLFPDLHDRRRLAK